MLTSIGVGPVYWFSNKPAKVPDDIKKRKIFVWAGDIKGTQLWKKLGFKPVPLSMVDLASGLKTGMVEAFSNIPVYVSASQLFEGMHMLKLEWSYILAGFMIRKKTFDRISPHDQKVLLDVIKKMKPRLEQQAKIQNEKALANMKRKVLKFMSQRKMKKNFGFMN